MLLYELESQGSRNAISCCIHVVAGALAAAGLAMCLFPAGAYGQVATTGQVRGTVVAENGTPVKGALVDLVGRADFARTAETGRFLFQDVHAGPQVLRIRALGFVQKSENILVIGDSGWAGSIVLARAPQALAEVNVTAPGKPPEFANTTKYDDFFRRQKLGQGTFRTRDDIEKMGAADFASVLQRIPGVTVSTTISPHSEPEIRMRLARCPGPRLAFYVNGTQVAVYGKSPGAREMGELLSAMPVSDILFVEFYRGPGQIPNDLERGDACAALVIWTR